MPNSEQSRLVVPRHFALTDADPSDFVVPEPGSSEIRPPVAGSSEIRPPVADPATTERSPAVGPTLRRTDDELMAVCEQLTALAAQLCDTPMAMLRMDHPDGPPIVSRYGLDPRHADALGEVLADRPRDAGREGLHLPDLRLDERAADHPLVVGGPRLRFYADEPLLSADGRLLGRVIVLDRIPRYLTDQQHAQLRLVAGQLVAQLTVRTLTHELAAEVAARQVSELAREANDRLLHGVLTHQDAAIYAKDLDGRYVLANTSTHELLDVGDGALMGRTDHDVMPKDLADAFRSNDLDVVRNGERTVMTELMHRRDGSSRQYLSTKFPLRDDSGAIFAVAGISTDVTAQRTAEEKLRKSERRWHQLFDASPVGIGLADEHGLFVAVNPALCTLFGRTEEDVIGHSSLEFTHPDDVESHRGANALLVNAETGIVRVEKRYVQPNGQHRWAWLTVTHTPGPEGQTWTLAHVQDVTERLATEQAVRDSEANLSAVAMVVQQVQTGSDARQTIVDACVELAGAAIVCLWELSADGDALEVTATNRPEQHGVTVVFNQTDSRWRSFLTGSLAFLPEAPGTPDGVASGDRARYIVPVKSRHTVTALLLVEWVEPVPQPTDRRALVVTMLADQAGVALSQRALLNELEILAHTDTLTALPNRRSWDRRFTELLVSSRRTGRQLVVALIDFDHFKAFNDTRGHAAGDTLLRNFAGRARNVLKAGDTLARWGGEEFALALGDCADEDILPVLTRVKASMPDGQTCSIGWAVVDPTESIDSLMVRVDTALYEAKNQGRDRIQQFRASLPEVHGRRRS